MLLHFTGGTDFYIQKCKECSGMHICVKPLKYISIHNGFKSVKLLRYLNNFSGLAANNLKKF